MEFKKRGGGGSSMALENVVLSMILEIWLRIWLALSPQWGSPRRTLGRRESHRSWPQIWELYKFQGIWPDWEVGLTLSEQTISWIGLQTEKNVCQPIKMLPFLLNHPSGSPIISSMKSTSSHSTQSRGNTRPSTNRWWLRTCVRLCIHFGMTSTVLNF